jgi:hypothetical protein
LQFARIIIPTQVHTPIICSDGSSGGPLGPYRALEPDLPVSSGQLVCLPASCRQTVAFAAVTFDPETGVGFVGKGEVQEAFGWNNRVLQNNADDVDFQFVSEVVTEVSWTCTNDNNQTTQERERTTTTSIDGLLDSVARERNQVTGFILEGFVGDAQVGEPTTDGPPLNSCPSGPWTLTTPAGEPELVSSTGGLQVGFGGLWIDLE